MSKVFKISTNSGAHQFDIEQVKAMKKEDFIKQFEHLDPVEAASFYDQIVAASKPEPKINSKLDVPKGE